MAAPGDVIAGRYRLDELVGSGAMGLVWQAWDLRLERRVALKQLRAPAGLSPADEALANQRAMREARITARLHHRYAVPVFDVVEHDGQPCLIMQFIPSVPLSSVIREGGSLLPREAARVGAQVGSALAAAHEVGIVHRDVKPGNILVADDGSALISDFGISHALGDATLTQTGMVHGTPAYLAPEVARGGDASYASDVFSLGATLYATLEGAPPFGSDANSIVLLHRVAAGRYDQPQRSGELTPLLVSMLSLSPDDRPAMSTVARELGMLSPPEAPTPPTVLLPASSASTIEPTQTAIEAATVPEPTRAEAQVTTVVTPPRVPDQTVAEVPPPDVGDPPPRRRLGGVLALVAVAVAVLAIVAFLTLRHPGGTGAVGDPDTTTSASSAAQPTRSTPPPSTGSASSSRPASSTAASSSAASTQPSRTPTPKKPTSTARASKVTADDLARAIRNYYALLPGNTDRAWPLMTAHYQNGQSGGRQSYEAFWGGIRRVSVSKITGTVPDKAQATLSYQFRNGRRAVERTSFQLVKDGGQLKINKSTVLSSS